MVIVASSKAGLLIYECTVVAPIGENFMVVWFWSLHTIDFCYDSILGLWRDSETQSHNIDVVIESVVALQGSREIVNHMKPQQPLKS